MLPPSKKGNDMKIRGTKQDLCLFWEGRIHHMIDMKERAKSNAARSILEGKIAIAQIMLEDFKLFEEENENLTEKNIQENTD
jgi:hypothetical protein